MDNSSVRAVNHLTSRWASRIPSRGPGTVFTAAGVWPLLALLADGADGPARAELEEALGIPAERAAQAARTLLDALGGVRGLQAATGLWTRAGLPLKDGWSTRLPAGTRGTLTGGAEDDAKTLDAWASDRTGGLIERMPVALGADTLLVLASALTLRLKWIKPFDSMPGRPEQGPWAGRDLRMLTRLTSVPDRARVAHGPAGPVTLLEVVGDTGVDVHLLLGTPTATPAEVLTTGLDAATRAAPSTPTSLLPEGEPGPGLTIRTVESLTPEPRLYVTTPAFEVRAEHDLLEDAALFGLASACDARSGHFPGISTEPLAVGSARQSAMARFHERGFEAAAVTAISLVAGSAPRRPGHRVREASVHIDRPFGFLAVHRTSRLALAAGWVTEPDTVRYDL